MNSTAMKIKNVIIVQPNKVSASGMKRPLSVILIAQFILMMKAVWAYVNMRQRDGMTTSNHVKIYMAFVILYENKMLFNTVYRMDWAHKSLRLQRIISVILQPCWKQTEVRVLKYIELISIEVQKRLIFILILLSYLLNYNKKIMVT